jgi:hypothetical protein
MTPLEDKVRQALRAKADQVPDAAPPLRLPARRRRFLSLAHRGGQRRGAPAWRGWLAPVAAAVSVAAVIAGSVTASQVFAGHKAEHARGGHAVSSQELGAAARTQAVTWILHQVSPATVVSCDAQVCTELAQRGFTNLETLGPESTDPLGSTLVVATAAVRAQFGRRLASAYAPAVLASFGSGNAKIEIRWNYPGGTAGYDAALGTDLRARKTQDAELLNIRNLRVSATARAQLLSGDVDPRLPMLLAAMTQRYPVRIVDFGDQSPGGGPASLLRSMDLATHVSAAHIGTRAYISWMQGLANAQWAEYLPASSEVVTLPAGQTVLRIAFDAPSPLG